MIAPENELENKEKELEQREKNVEVKNNTALLTLAAAIGLASGALLAIRFGKIQSIQVMPPPDTYAKLWKALQESGKLPIVTTTLRESILVPVEEAA